MPNALIVSRFGSAPEFSTRTPGRPRPGELLVGVRACGLNFADLLMIEGKYQETPALPFVPGMEISGEVLEVGADVADFQPGDRIAAFPGQGGLAAHVVAKANRCQRIPDTMDDATAAGFQVAYGTSHLALTRRAALAPGETLAVLGAAGGVGLTAVEIGKALGARVIAVARGEAKLAAAGRAGADVLIDAQSDDLLGKLREAGPLNVVYDPVGGAAGEAALRALAPEGRYLVIGFASGDLPALRPNHLLVKNISVIGFYWGGYLAFRPDLVTEGLAEMMDWHAEGRLHPHIGHVLPFERALDGLELLRSRQATGKVVITL